MGIQLLLSLFMPDKPSTSDDALGGPGVVKKFMKVATTCILAAAVGFHVMCVVGIVPVERPAKEVRPILINKFLRLYIAVFCALSLLLECELSCSVSSSGLLWHWSARGLWYIFVGLLTMSYEDTIDVTFRPLQDAIGIALLVAGSLYVFFFGVLFAVYFKAPGRSVSKTFANQ